MVKDTESKARLQEELMCTFASFVLDMPLGCTTFIVKFLDFMETSQEWRASLSS